MNTKVLAGLAVIIIIGIGAYVVWGRGGTGGYGPVTTVPIGGATSLQTLVAAGSPVVCTFSTTTASGSESGTIYISNGMAAGDFVANDSGASPINAYMIVKDATSYAWTSATDQGFKSTVGANGSGQNQSVGYTTQMDYSCQAWTPDSNKFNLPANVSFTATAGYVPPAGAGESVTGATTGVKGTAEQCAACNNLQGAQKAQCLVALSC
jgi:hypothetical protein